MAGTGGDHVTVEQDSKAIITGLESHNQRGYRQAADILSRDSQNPNTFRQIMAKVHDGIKNDPKAMKELHHLELVDGSAEPHAKLKHDKEPGRKPQRSERTSERTTGDETATERQPEKPETAQDRDQQEKATGAKLGLTDKEVGRAQALRDGQPPDPPLTEKEQVKIDQYTNSHGHPPETAGEFMTALYDKTAGADGKTRDVSPQAVKKAEAQERLERATNDVDGDQKTPPLLPKEGYFQALQRMHPDWDGHKLSVEAARLKAANGGRTNLKVGEQFDTISKEERSDRIGKRYSELEGRDRTETDQTYKDQAQAKHDKLKDQIKEQLKKTTPGLSDDDAETQAEQKATDQEKAARDKIAKGSEDEFHHQLDQQGPNAAKLPSVESLMGLTPAQAKSIQDAQAQGDTRSSGDIAVARGWTSEDEAKAAADKLEDLRGEQDKAFKKVADDTHKDKVDKAQAKKETEATPDKPAPTREETDKAVTAQESQDREKKGEDAETQFEKNLVNNPNTPIPSESQLLGLDPAQVDSIKQAQDNGDTRTAAEIAQARGWVQPEEVEKVKELEKSQQQALNKNRDVVSSQAEEKYQTDGTVPSPAKMAGLTDAQEAEFNKMQQASKSYTLSDYLQEKFGLEKDDADKSADEATKKSEGMQQWSQQTSDNQTQAFNGTLKSIALDHTEKDPTKLISEDALSGLPQEQLDQIHDYQKQHPDAGSVLDIALKAKLINKPQYDAAMKGLSELSFIAKNLPAGWGDMKPEQRIPVLQRLIAQFEAAQTH